MAISQINDGDAGSSVRSKLNSAIDGVNNSAFSLGVADPTTGVGVAAELHAEGYTTETPPRYFKKTGEGDTDWSLIAVTVDGEFILSPVLSDASADVLDDGELGLVNGRIRVGDGVTTGGQPSSGAIHKNTYFVDPVNGDDTTGAVAESPYQTINAALLAAESNGETSAQIYCMSGIYTETDVLNGVTSSAVFTFHFDVGSFFRSTGIAFDNTTANLSIASITGYLAVQNSVDSFLKGTLYGAETCCVEILSISGIALGAGKYLFDITGGKASIEIKTPRYNASSAGFAQLFRASGSASLIVRNLKMHNSGGVVFSEALFVAFIEGTATATFINAHIRNLGLCKILTDTACSVIVQGCICGIQYDLGGTGSLVTAPAASTNPTAYAVGVNSATNAMENITPNTDMGSVNVTNTAYNALEI